MKHQPLRSLRRVSLLASLFYGILIVLHAENGTQSSLQLRVDWPSFLHNQDPVWDRMPTNYFQGPFVGNGLLGTIIFRDDKETNSLRFEIGRTDVYDHRAMTR